MLVEIAGWKIIDGINRIVGTNKNFLLIMILLSLGMFNVMIFITADLACSI